LNPSLAPIIPEICLDSLPLQDRYKERNVPFLVQLSFPDPVQLAQDVPEHSCAAAGYVEILVLKRFSEGKTGKTKGGT